MARCTGTGGIVENRRLPGGRVCRRHVLYLGEINSSQERARRKSIDVLDERTEESRRLSLFPEDRIDEALVDESVVSIATAPVSSAHVGCVLVGAEAVGTTGTGSVLGGACFP